MGDRSPPLPKVAFAKPADFPDEILDSIIGAIGAIRYGVGSQRLIYSEQRKIVTTWSACCLVCKRWRSITIPHLFHSLSVLLFDGPTSSGYIQFFTETSWIAIHVRQFRIVDTDSLDIHELNSLLKALPSLNSLILDEVDASKHVAPEDHDLIPSYHLQTLEYHSQPDLPWSSLEHVLALFSWIGTLVVGFNEADHLIDVSNGSDNLGESLVRSRSGKTCIESIRCGGRNPIGLFLPSYLDRIGALTKLASLTYRIFSKDDPQSLACFLKATCTTLRFLRIEVVITDREHDFISGLQDVLPLCEEINAFELALIIGLNRSVHTFSFDTHPVTQQRHVPTEIHAKSWSLALQLLKVVSVTKLNRTSLRLSGSIGDIHALDWHQLKAWLSTICNLKEVEIHLTSIHDQRACLVYEMREFEHVFTPSHISRPIILFPRRPVVPREWKCQDESCRKYTQEH